jgi:hypothetical protein
VPRLCELYPGICLTTEEKARKNVNQGIVYIKAYHAVRFFTRTIQSTHIRHISVKCILILSSSLHLIFLNRHSAFRFSTTILYLYFLFSMCTMRIFNLIVVRLILLAEYKSLRLLQYTYKVTPHFVSFLHRYTYSCR